MIAEITVELFRKPETADIAELYDAATWLARGDSGILLHVRPERAEVEITLSMPVSKQASAAEEVLRAFRITVSAYAGMSVRFRKEEKPAKPDSELPTKRQSQYLSFIHDYTRINGRPPAQADIQRHFEVTPPTVQQMILNLEKNGFLSRTPGNARSLIVNPDYIGMLNQ